MINEMSEEELKEIAKTWSSCAFCDHGETLEFCTCPEGIDPRPVINNLITELRKARAQRDAAVEHIGCLHDNPVAARMKEQRDLARDALAEIVEKMQWGIRFEFYDYRNNKESTSTVTAISRKDDSIGTESAAHEMIAIGDPEFGKNHRLVYRIMTDWVEVNE